MGKLHEVIAVEKDVKSKAHATTTDLYRMLQNAQLFQGMDRTYTPLDDDGEGFPPESQKVQVNTRKLFEMLLQARQRVCDLVYTKDSANANAVGVVTLTGGDYEMPVSTILHMEKELKDLRDVLAATPELDPSIDWDWDEKALLHRSETIKTHKTRKVEEPKPIFQPTEHQPGQYHIFTRDVTIGHWETTKLSSGIPRGLKVQLIDRCDELGRAMKKARERANSVDAPEKSLKGLLDWVLEPLTNGTTSNGSSD